MLVLLLSAISICANAQKLPKIQTTSLRLPENVKIDGKATEWDNKFQAYNTNTSLFYTIANDNDRIYLAVQATDPLTIRKIMAASLTVSIDHSAINKGTADITFTYPVFDKKNMPNIGLKNKPQPTKNETADRKVLDSFMYVINNELTNKAKEIRVFGVKDVDTSLSVYNETGIKAAARFDHQIAYTYELAIPLKYINANIDGQGKFNYTIKLNGSNNFEGIRIIEQPGGGVATYWDGERPSKTDVQFFRYPINFTGSYTLVKK